MKATELIKKLAELIAEHGDLDVTVYDEDERDQYDFGYILHTATNDHGCSIKPSFEISHAGYGN